MPNGTTLNNAQWKLKRLAISAGAWLVCWALIVPAKANPNPGDIPIVFVPTPGLGGVRFTVESPGLAAGVLDDGVLFQTGGSTIQMRFRDMELGARLEGTDRLSATVSIFRGNDPKQWRPEVPAFGGVVFCDLYPGIDAAYRGAGNRIKTEFRVAPGADAHKIHWDYPGSTKVDVTPSGNLRVHAERLELLDSPPEIFTESATGERTAVKGRYRVLQDQSVGFEVDDYDHSLTLVIDPVITYSTFLGGSGQGAVTAVARDGLGDLYAAGWTDSLDFPIAGALQAANAGGVDSFVVKLDPTGTTLLYATYIGGNGDDRIAGIAVDGTGQVHVAGATGSSNFPLFWAARSSFVGGKEAFALKLNAAGSALVYSTYLGGSNYDLATAIAVDGGGYAYVAGDTLSADFGVLSATQSAYGGQQDAFLTKLNAAGAITFSTFLGGSLAEHVGGVTTDGTGVAYLAGGTFSTNLPLALPLQSTNAGGQDAFVAKIKTTATPSLLFSTYLGGTGGSAALPEQANAIALDASANIYVAGVVSSTDFPITSGAVQTVAGGSRDAFITKFNAAATARVYSTYLGWTGFDWASGIAVDGSGNAYVAGYTSSVSFANIGGVQAAFNGIYDGFVSKLSASGNTLVFSTLYGGTRADQINAIAVDTNGNMFLGGQTSSYDFPIQNALQAGNVSGNTGWVARLGVTAPPSQVPSVGSIDVVYGQNGAATITAQFSHPAGAGALTSVAVLLSRTASVDFACLITYSPTTNTLTLAGDIAASGGVALTPGSGSASNSQCQLTGTGSSVLLVGNNLTLTLAVVLQPGFPGNSTVYGYAADTNVNTGWVARVGVSNVSADTVSPSSGSGASQTFTFVFSDTKSSSNILTTAILINSTLSGTNACWLVYDKSTGKVALLNDAGTGSASKPMGSTANLHNSQCALGAPSLAVSGNSILLTIPLSFYGAFTGSKSVYMLALGPNNNTGWVQRGTYSVVAGGVPVAKSVTPASGSGSDQAFSFVISDQGGANFLWAAAMLFSRSTNFDLNNGCYVVWDRTTNKLALFKDTYTSGSNSFVLGSGAVAGNSQCILRDSGSSVTVGATSITVTIHLTFSASFAGNKNSFLYASEPGYNSGWKLVGNWTVPGTAPTVSTLTPTSGSGANQNFTASATTAVNPTDLTRISILATASSTANACYVVYNRTNSTIGLYDDAGTTLSTKPLGSSANLQNTQCAIGYSVSSSSGNSASITVQIVFKSPAFSGAKTVKVEAANVWGSSGFISKGTWTVP